MRRGEGIGLIWSRWCLQEVVGKTLQVVWDQIVNCPASQSEKLHESDDSEPLKVIEYVRKLLRKSRVGELISQKILDLEGS